MNDPTLRILLVDDDQVDRMSVSRALRGSGIAGELVEAVDVESALQRLQEGFFDCVFLDFELPGGSGLKVLTQARAAGIHSPIVVLTGRDDGETVAQLMKAGASDYLNKSTATPERLLDALRHAVRVHQAEEQARRVEQALRASEQRFRSLVEATSQAVWTAAADGQVVEDIPSWRALTGQTLDEVLGMGWLNAIHPEDRERTLQEWVRGVESGTAYEVEHRIRRHDGEYRHMLARAVPIFDQHGAVVEWIGTHTDITRRKVAEEERERAIAARNRFYAVMSHELRTPINAILGYTDLLLMGTYGPIPEAQVHGIERTHRAAQHLLDLVNDALDLSKIEAGKLEVQPELMSLPQLLEDLLATAQPLAEERGTDVQLSGLDCSEPFLSDPRRVRQIMLNLISNAIKFGAGRPVRIHCARAPDGRYVVEVADQGAGIPPEDLPRVFDEFVQLGDPEQGGTGLGLPISKRLAELLGGELQADSRLGEGSVFRLILPPTLEELEVLTAQEA